MDNYSMWHIKPLSPKEFQDLSFHKQAEYLCHLASLAPSSHNSQPWRFFIDEKRGHIEVYLDRQFVLSASDTAGRQAVISIGCAIENLIIGAGYLGEDARVEIRSVSTDDVRPRRKKTDKQYIFLTRIHYTIPKSQALLKPLYKSIFMRKVMRAEFDQGRSIPKEVIKKLENVCDGKRTKLHLIADAVRRLGIAEFQHQADGYVINSPTFSRELGEWLLPNDTPSPVGMPGTGFGLKDAEAIRIHEGLMEKRPLEPEDGLKFALAGKMGIEKSPIICCITIPKDNVSYWIDAGRAFERMFLTLDSHGLSVAVHAGIIEVSLVTRMFGLSLGTLRRPAVLFRIGYVKDPKHNDRPHSPRLPLEKIVLRERPAMIA